MVNLARVPFKWCLQGHPFHYHLIAIEMQKSLLSADSVHYTLVMAAFRRRINTRRCRGNDAARVLHSAEWAITPDTLNVYFTTKRRGA